MAQRNQWTRRTAPPNHPVVKKKSSISDWIQRVQNASEDAVQEVLGGELFQSGSLKEIIPDDEAVYEAQELVDGWMRETSLSNLQNELDHKNENWASTTGYLLSDRDYPSYSENTMFDELQQKYLNEDDTFSSSAPDRFMTYGNVEVDDIDDELLVKDVLHGMLEKDFAGNIDLGMKPLAEKATNPVPRMDIRHEQVRLKGERRRKKNLEKKEKKLTHEEIIQKARERVVLEERQRIQREKIEEKAILTEMEKIKIELAAEKQKQDEEIHQKKKILNEAKLQMQIELRKEREEEMRCKREKQEVRRQIQKNMEEEAVRELKMHMMILHKYFSAWYNIVLEQRLRIGKAQAIADWKRKVRSWTAWKAYVACVKSSEEAKAIENAMKEKYRKEQMSILHSNKTILRKCFGSWLKYSRYKAKKALLKYEHEEKAKKMALFLEAASKGLIREEKSPEHFVGPRSKINHNTNLSKVEEESKSVQVKENYTVDLKGKPEILEDAATPVHVEPTIKDSNSNHKSTQRTCDDDISKKKPAKKPTHKDHVLPNLDGESTSNKSKVTKNNKDKESHTGMISNISEHVSDRASQDKDNKLLTDRSDRSCASTISSLVSRKPHARSEKQITKPLFLAMEEREKERQKRKSAIEEERRKREEERLKLLQAKEAERLKQEQNEKDDKLRQKLEQKKLEALKQKEKEFQLQQARLNMTKAKAHYEKVLLHKYGIEPLMRLIQIKRLNIQISDEYHNTLLLRLCFVEWHGYVKSINLLKREKADQCYQQILLKRSFQSWLKYRFHLQSMNKIAKNFSSLNALRHAFGAWQEFVTDERILMWAKESNAEEHDTKRMITGSFKAWVKFVKLEKEERERECRKDEFRRKVQSWLPDYKGGNDT